MIVHAGNGQEAGLIVLRLRQAFIALGPILITISLGLAEGYSAVLIPQLEDDPNWNVDTELSSWIASITTLPMAVGCLLGGWLMEVIGRKMLHIVTCIPNFIGWLLIAFCGNSVSLLLAGRFITGMCVGVLSTVLLIYVAETSDPIFRGFLLPCISLALNIGISVSHIMGTYLNWKLVALLACIYPTLCFFLMLFVPESPTYLIKKGNVKKAKNCFIWFRGHSEESRIELDLLISRQEQETSLPQKNFIEYLKVFKQPEFYKPLIILVVFFSTMQLSGANPIAFYTVNILKQVLGDSVIDPYTSLLIMDGIRIIASILGCFGLQYIKRRKLMMLSGAGTFISLLILSSYLYITGTNTKLAWIAVAAFIGYVFCINVGLMPLAYSMSGELFGQSSRGLGSALLTSFNMILMFTLVKLTPWLLDTLQTDGMFMLFAVCCLLGIIALVVVLPETKDKPLHEIEDYFKGSQK